MYRELKFKYRLNEAYTIEWQDEETLRGMLSEEILACVNNDDWQDAQNLAESPQEISAISELFLVTNSQIRPYLNNLKNGKDIVIGWVNQLGFKQLNNPYLKYIPNFFKSNMDVVFTREDFIALNDFYANDVIKEADLLGTGKLKLNHLVYNKFLYASKAEGMDYAQGKIKFMQYFQYLCNDNNVKKLNIEAIMELPSNPYTKKFNDLEVKPSPLTGCIQTNDDIEKVRNIIIYKDPNQVLGDIETLYWVDKALRVSSGSEVVQGVSREDRIKDVVNNIEDGKYTGDELKGILQALQKIGVTK